MAVVVAGRPLLGRKTPVLHVTWGNGWPPRQGCFANPKDGDGHGVFWYPVFLITHFKWRLSVSSCCERWPCWTGREHLLSLEQIPTVTWLFTLHQKLGTDMDSICSKLDVYWTRNRVFCHSNDFKWWLLLRGSPKRRPVDPEHGGWANSGARNVGTVLFATSLRYETMTRRGWSVEARELNKGCQDMSRCMKPK